MGIIVCFPIFAKYCKNYFLMKRHIKFLFEEKIENYSQLNTIQVYSTILLPLLLRKNSL